MKHNFIPLSYAQQGLWFLDQCIEDKSVYHVTLNWKIIGEINIVQLKSALNKIVTRHEILRTKFTMSNEGLSQVPEDGSNLDFLLEDLSKLPQKEIDEKVIQYLKQPFNLSERPPLRVCCLKISKDVNLVLIVMHHIIFDGWSSDIFANELSFFYNLKAKDNSDLPALPFQYADFTLWQKEKLIVRFPQQLQYWKEYLKGYEGLRLDFGGSTLKRRSKGNLCSYKLEALLVSRLYEVAKQNAATPFMVLLSVFFTLLHRYALINDMVLGIPVANRQYKGIEGLMGIFINPLPIRSKVTAATSFIELLDGIRQSTINMHKNQDLPFDKIIEALAIPVERSKHPLFQIMFGFHSEEVLPKLNNLRIEPFTVNLECTRVDLTLSAKQKGQEILLEFEFDTNIFPSDQLELMAKDFIQLTEAILDNQHTSIWDIGLLSTHKLLDNKKLWWNDAVVDLDNSLAHCFVTNAIKNPKSIAVSAGEHSLTYEELNIKSNQFAHYLISLGVKPEIKLGIYVERSVEYIVSLLAIVKAGAAYVPLDIAYPVSRLSEIIEISEISYLISSEHLLDNLPSVLLQFLQIITLEGDQEEILKNSPFLPRLYTHSDNLAYIMFTSGTSGQRPKGAMISQQNIIRLAASPTYIDITKEDVVLQAASLAFDASTFEIWCALLNGAQLVLLPGNHFSLDELSDTVLNRGVTTLWLTSSLFNFVVEHNVQIIRSVKKLLVGGDVVSVDSIKKLRHHFPCIKVLNGYGPTEATTFSTTYEIPEIGYENTSIPIGSPINSTYLLVLDEDLKLTPWGAVGELYIGGKGLARGYLNDPVATSKCFIPCPLNDFSGERIYKTGDRVRFLPNGNLEFKGRMDEQIKIRGFRIEPSEIEHSMSKHSAIKLAYVTALRHHSEKILVAYYVLNQSAPMITEDELRQYLKMNLPDFMIPSHMIEIDELPLTLNGKVDLAKLPTIEEREIKLNEFKLPSNSLETMLVQIWINILKISTVSTDESFFNLGGDSLLAIQLKIEVQKNGYVFELEELFVHQTISDLAKILKNFKPKSKEKEIVPFSLIHSNDKILIDTNIVDAYPASCLQQGMLFYSKYNNEACIYHDIIMYEIHLPFNQQQLETILKGLTEKHEILRTAFNFEDFSQALQLVYHSVLIPLEIYDLKEQHHRYEEILNRWLDNEKTRGFKWTEPPLLRVGAHLIKDDIFILSLSFHHAIIDGWSESHLISEIVKSYKDGLNGITYKCLPLKSRYREFISEEINSIQSEKKMQFWKHWIENCPKTMLSSTHAEILENVPRQTFVIKIPTVILNKLQTLSKKAEVSLREVLLCCHLQTIGCMTGQHYVTTGVVSHGRLDAEDGEKVLGLFLNTLPFKCELINESWIDFSKRVWRIQQEMTPFRQYPFVKIIELTNNEEIFNSLFNYLNFHVYKELKTSSPELVKNRSGYAENNFGVSTNFCMTEHNDLEIIVTCRENFSIQFMENLKFYYEEIINQMAEDPYTAIKIPDYNFKKHSSLAQLSSNHSNPFSERLPSYHEIFENIVARFPNKIAIQSETHSISYKDLNLKANILAQKINSFEKKSEIYVAVCLERSIETIIAALACLKAGGVYLPLDPTLPVDRLIYILNETSSAILITSSALRNTLSFFEHTIIELDCLTEDNNEISFNSVPTRSPLALSYIIYTSGSTGRPKGAANTHQGLMNRIVWMQKDYKIDENDIVLHKTSCGFDVSVWEIFGPLLAGAKTIIVPPGGHKDPIVLAELIKKFEVTIVHFVPSVLREFLNYAQHEHCRSIRQLFVGGEKFDLDLQAQCFKTIKGNISNVYGPAEVAIDVTHWQCAPNERAVSIPIGFPVDNTYIYILGKSLEILPPELPGEIYISGIGVGRGYLMRSDLTAERFLPNPYSMDPGERMYKTGDIGFYTKRGEIHYLGRVDFQVKIRGFRIELEEIEKVINKHSLVHMSIVLVKEHGSDKQLVAFIIKKGAMEILHPEESIKQHIGLTLPYYMIPDRIIFITKMPITSNGKLDRKALLDLVEHHAVDNKTTERNANPIESRLLKIWAEILKVDEHLISLADNFFKMGGHSLTAMRLVVNIRQQFEIEFQIRAAFEYPTLETMAEEINKLIKEGECQLPILTKVMAEKYPLSFAQQRLWFLDKLFANKSVYHIPIVYNFKGSLNLEYMNNALLKLIELHAILKTVIYEEEGIAYQKMDHVFSLIFNSLDLSDLPLITRNLELKILLESEAIKPFNFEKPLFRTTLIKLHENEFVLALTLHHLIADALSVEILWHDFSLLYNAHANAHGNAQSNNEVVPLQKDNVNYLDFAVWQRTWLTGDKLEERLSYWRKKLAGIPSLITLSIAKRRPPIPSNAGEHYRFKLDLNLSHQLKQLAVRHEVTLFMLLLTGFKLLLNRYSGEFDIVVGVPIANRHYAGAERIVGFFANTIVLRTQIYLHKNFNDLLASVKKTTLEAYQYQDLPFESLVEDLNIDRDISFHPCFQIMFGFYKSGNAVELSGLKTEAMDPNYPVSKFDLTLMCEEKADGELYLTFEYATDLFCKRDIEKIANELCNLYKNVSQDHNPSISSLISSARTIDPLNITNIPSIKQVSNLKHDFVPVHTLFERQVFSTPDKIAVSYDSIKLTYNELNVRANQLAHVILQSNLQTNTHLNDCLIAIYSNNKLNVLIAILAILKVGKGYLPIDTRLPNTRIELLLAESGVRIILSESELLNNLQALNVSVIAIGSVMNSALIDKNIQCPNTCTVVNFNDIAYSLYTSGSTGKPKAVLITQNNLFNSTMSRFFYYSDPIDRYLLLSPFTFDSSVAGIFWTLLCGGQLVIPSSYDIHTILSLIEHEKISHLLTTPSFYRQLLANRDYSKNHYLKIVIVAGEAILPGLIEKHHQYFPNATLYNEYGPTEFCVWATVKKITDLMSHSRSYQNNIGTPIGNTDVFILNHELYPVLDSQGEICLSGDNLTLGYLGDPALTAEKYIPNPFANKPGSRMYKTGDIGYYIQDGELEFIGRVDEQIKINGIRIETGEIETILCSHPEVEEAVVYGARTSAVRQELIAYIVLSNNIGLNEVEISSYQTTLLDFLTSRLPGYMLPNRIIILDSLPKNHHGKIDRNALSAITSEKRTTSIAPRSETEFRLTQMVTELLEIPYIGMRDNLFHRGANSLLLLVLSAKIKRKFGKTVQVSELFTHPTIEKIAQLLNEPNIIQEPIVNISKGNSSTSKLYLIHPAAGLAFPYITLSEFCENRTIYGISNPYFGHETFKFQSIEAMANYYLQFILKEGSEDIQLGGWSFGGVVAYEMACQLTKLGKKITQLLLIDSHNYSSYPTVLLSESTVDLEIKQFIENQTISMHSDEGVALKTELLNNFELIRNYIPKSYLNDVCLIKAGKRIEGKTYLKGKLDNGWGEVIQGKLIIKEVPFTHEELFNEENVSELARVLEEVL